MGAGTPPGYPDSLPDNAQARRLLMDLPQDMAAARNMLRRLRDVGA